MAKRDKAPTALKDTADAIASQFLIASEQAEDKSFVKCEQCSDTGFVSTSEDDGYHYVRRCACSAQTRIERREAIIPPEFQDVPTSIQDLTADRKRHPVQADVVSAMQADPFRSYVLCGRFGSGKTHLAWALWRHVLHHSSLQMVATSLVSLSAQYRQGAISDTRDLSTRPAIDAEMLSGGSRYCIFLDDIDKVKMSDFIAERLFDLADAIYTHDHMVILTTNLTLGELVDYYASVDKRYGGSIIRRLVGRAEIFELFNGGDRR